MRTPSSLTLPALTAASSTEEFEQVNLGQCGLALTLALKHVLVDRTYATGWIAREIEILCQFPEPDARRMIRLALSFLSKAEEEALKAIGMAVETWFLSEDADEALEPAA